MQLYANSVGAMTIPDKETRCVNVPLQKRQKQLELITPIVKRECSTQSRGVCVSHKQVNSTYISNVVQTTPSAIKRFNSSASSAVKLSNKTVRFTLPTSPKPKSYNRPYAWCNSYGSYLYFSGSETMYLLIDDMWFTSHLLTNPAIFELSCSFLSDISPHKLIKSLKSSSVYSILYLGSYWWSVCNTKRVGNKILRGSYNLTFLPSGLLKKNRAQRRYIKFRKNQSWLTPSYCSPSIPVWPKPVKNYPYYRNYFSSEVLESLQWRHYRRFSEHTHCVSDVSDNVSDECLSDWCSSDDPSDLGITSDLELSILPPPPQLQTQLGFTLNLNSNFADSIDLVTNSVTNSITDSIRILTNTLRDVMPSIAASVLAKVVRFIVFLWELCSDSSVSSKLRSGVQCFSDYVFTDSILSDTQQVVEAMRPVLNRIFGVGNRELVAQVGGSIHGEHLVKSVCALFCSFLGVTTSVPLECARVSRLVNVVKTIKSISTLWDWMSELAVVCMERVGTYIGAPSYVDSVLKKLREEIPDWMRECMKMTSLAENEIHSSIELREKIISLKRRGDVYATDLQAANIPSGVTSYFARVNEDIKRLCKLAAPHMYHDRMRVAPFVVCLIGGAGVGKSTLQNYLVKDLFIRANLPFDPAGDLYVRNNQQEHWDGYFNQPAVIFDDFLQANDRQINTRELTELIGIKNNTSYPLKTAELERKGATYFSSSFVCLTSNTGIDNSVTNYVRSIEAVKRRIDATITVSVLPAFSTTGQLGGKVDVTKCASFSMDIYQFELGKCVMSYEALLLCLSARWLLMRSKDEHLITRLNSYVGYTGVSTCVNNLGVAVDPVLVTQSGWSLSSIYHAYYPRVPVLVKSIKDATEIVYHDCAEFAHDRLDCYFTALSAWQSYLAVKRTEYSTVLSVLGVLSTALSLLKVGSLLYGSFYSSTVPETKIDRLFAESKPQFVRRTQKHYVSESKPQFVRRVKKSYVAESKPQFVRRINNKYVAESNHPSFTTEAALERIPKDFGFLTQDARDPQLMNLIDSLTINNVVRLHIGKHVVNGVFLCDRILMLPYHFLRSKQSSTMIIETRHYTYPIDLPGIERVDDPTRDVTFLRVPLEIPAFTDITKHFYDLDAITGSMIDSAVIVILSRTQMFAPELLPASNLTSEDNISYTSSPELDGRTYTVEGFRYESPTLPGDCGSLTFLQHRGVRRKILGFHVAGVDGLGACNSLTRSYIKQQLAKFGDLVRPQIGVLGPLTTQCFIDPDDVVEIYGCVKPDAGVRTPSITSIIPSPLHNCFPVTTAPAMLIPHGDINPMRIAIEKQFTIEGEFDYKVVNSISGDLSNCFNFYHSSYKKMGVLSDDVAINGIPGDKYIRPINFKTSPGYPYVLAREGKGKGEWFEGPEGARTMCEYLQERVDDRIVRASEGLIPQTLFVDTIKDERRPLEKAASGKSRVFNIAPVDLTIVVRKYFLAFVAHCMSNCVLGECSVGINAHGDDWHMMFRHLSSRNGKYLAGDYSNYDKRLPYTLIMAAFKTITDFYGHDAKGNHVRRVLFETMFSAYHLCGRAVYRVRKGNPSGIPLTGIINSLVNSLIARYTFVVLGRSHGLHVTMRDFHLNVIFKSYGDDNLFGVSREYPWFNMCTISTCLKEVGIIYTPADKSEIRSEFVALEDLTYLKRNFVHLDGKWVGPLDIDVIRESIMWMRNDNPLSSDEAISATYRSAIFEMTHHGKAAFLEYRNQVVKYANTKNVRLDHYEYDDVIEEAALGLFDEL